jgi:hypothetical protein
VNILARPAPVHVAHDRLDLRSSHCSSERFGTSEGVGGSALGAASPSATPPFLSFRSGGTGATGQTGSRAAPNVESSCPSIEVGPSSAGVGPADRSSRGDGRSADGCRRLPASSVCS